MKINRSKAMVLRKAKPMHGSPRHSLFYGDPVEMKEEQVAEAVAQPETVQDTIDQAVVEPAQTEDVAAERLQAFDEMSRTERAEVTVLPPLSVTNGIIIVKPVVKGISASNLDYLLQRALVDYPALGKVKVAQAVDPSGDPGHYSVSFTAADYAASGLKAMPFFRFNLSASSLNARPGGNYSIWIEGTTENGESITTEVYTFQRVDATKAVLGIMIPFRVIATRTLPFLGMFGSDGDVTRTFTIHITGMDPNDNEVFSVTHPGYSTAETKVIAELFSLPAGLAL